MLLRRVNKGEPAHIHIVDIWQAGFKPVYRVRLKDGSSATVSEDHSFLASEGWLRLSLCRSPSDK